jgi:hypothetical protein
MLQKFMKTLMLKEFQIWAALAFKPLQHCLSQMSVLLPGLPTFFKSTFY